MTVLCLTVVGKLVGSEVGWRAACSSIARCNVLAFVLWLGDKVIHAEPRAPDPKRGAQAKG